MAITIPDKKTEALIRMIGRRTGESMSVVARGHPGQLEFGDCLVCAVAKYRDLPLLLARNDFFHTDITPALAPET
ncbi:MAG: hypothetical protein BroJett030_18090 [Alphaproteobacteria bacterium]|nr:MAG: hypothetical protein BroJett030_18090 [Alphaproteobacteria bacterium]